MKDIQEIMSEMNKVSDEMAVTVEQVQQVLPGLGLACNCANACNGGVAGLTSCGGTANRVVTATPCIITAPRNFVFANLANVNSSIAYSLTGLRALVEPCACTSGGTTRTVYAVRIIGCISYTVNVPLLAPTTTTCTAAFRNNALITGTTPTVYACCCCGSAPVDNVLGYTCSIESAALITGIINANLTCNFITPSLTITPNSANNIASAQVTFTFPNLCTPATGLSAE